MELLLIFSSRDPRARRPRRAAVGRRHPDHEPRSERPDERGVALVCIRHRQIYPAVAASRGGEPNSPRRAGRGLLIRLAEPAGRSGRSPGDEARRTASLARSRRGSGAGPPRRAHRPEPGDPFGDRRVGREQAADLAAGQRVDDVEVANAGFAAGAGAGAGCRGSAGRCAIRSSRPGRCGWPPRASRAPGRGPPGRPSGPRRSCPRRTPDRARPRAG